MTYVEKIIKFFTEAFKPSNTSTQAARSKFKIVSVRTQSYSTNSNNNLNDNSQTTAENPNKFPLADVALHKDKFSGKSGIYIIRLEGTITKYL